MSRGLIFHIRENLSPDELRKLTGRIGREHDVKVHAQASGRAHLHFVSSEMPPSAIRYAVREQGYHARWVDL